MITPEILTQIIGETGKTDWAYVAFIGLKPSALAVKIATLKAHLQVPFSLHIWYSPSHQEPEQLPPHVIRFQEWVALHCPDHTLHLHKSPMNLPDWAQSHPNTALMYDADCGPASTVAQTILQLQTIHCIYLHSDLDFLMLSGNGNSHRIALTNLGLTPLLNLYGLQNQTSAQFQTIFNNIQLPSDFTSPFCFEANGLEFQGAFERSGRLYLLAEMNSFTENNRERLRALLAYYEYQNLRPVIGIIFSPIMDPSANQKTLDAHALLQQRIPSSPSFIYIHQFSQLKNLIEGDRLLICALGNDPASTLAAILHHQCQRTLIVYDQTTPEVVDNWNNLVREEDALQTQILGLPSTFWGDDLVTTLLPLLRREKAAIYFNITPGSKIQTQLFTQIFKSLQTTHSNSEMWAMNYQKRKVLRLDRTGESSLSQTPLDLLARVRGGGLISGSEYQNTEWSKSSGHEFLQQLFESYSEEVNSNNIQYDLSPITHWQNGIIRNTKNGHRYNMTEPLDKATHAGTWFELAIATRLNQLFKPEEIRINLKFGLASADTEMDIALRKDNFILCFECKSAGMNTLFRQNQPNSNPAKFLRMLGKIRHDAFRNFGSKAVPILVVPLAPPEMRAYCPPEDGFVLLLDLQDLTPQGVFQEEDFYDRGTLKKRPKLFNIIHNHFNFN
jgi:hypothetical protein